MVAIEVLRTLFSYDPDTGAVTWRESCGRWKRIPAGSDVGTLDRSGYRRVILNGKVEYAHRIAWALTHECWPTDQIDHINGNRADNRLCNLREASNGQNSMNRDVQTNNRSTGVKGVYANANGGFDAKIGANGQKFYVGHFGTIADAKAARDAKAEELHGAFAKH